MNAAHPTKEEFVAWLTGTLDSERILAMETHVNNCGECLTALESIDQSCNPIQQRIRDACQPPLDGDRTADFNIQALTPTLDRKPLDSTIDLGTDKPRAMFTKVPSQDDDRYDVRGVIARGGMGEVRLAKDNAIRRLVAMKVIRAESNNENRTSRFIEEAQITGQLEHPGIVPVHEIGVAPDGNLFYTMKRIHGQTLKEILQAVRDQEPQTLQAFPLVRLLGIVERVCDAIAFAHSKGVIHRDIKPENIMVGDFGEVLVVDWGLAKVIAGESIQDGEVVSKNQAEGLVIESVRQQSESDVELTMEGSIMGTPSFMAPEQASGRLRDIDERTDVYGIGAVLYNILALRPPIVASNLSELLQRAQDGEITSPTDCDSLPKGWTVPSSLALVCMKALAKSSADRYQNVRELSADVQAFRGGFATSVENAGFLKQSQLLVKRHRGITTSVAVAILMGVVGSGVYLYRINDALNKTDAALGQARQSNIQANLALAKMETAEAVARNERRSAINQLGKTQIAFAETAFLSGDALRAKNYLKDCPEEARDTHWRYLDHHSDPALYHKGFGYVRGIHADPTKPDRFYLIRQSDTLIYCEGRTGHIEERIDIGHGYMEMAISPDGQRIVTIPREANIKSTVLSTHPLKKLSEFEVELQQGAAAFFAKDSRTVFTSTEKFITNKIDPGDGKVKVFRKNFQAKACFNNSPVVVGFRPNRIVAVNYETNEELWAVPSVGWVSSMAVSFDDKYVVTCSWTGDLAVHDASSGEKRKAFRAYDSTKPFPIRILCSKRSHQIMTLGHDANRKSLKMWHIEQDSIEPLRAICCGDGDPLQFGWNPMSNTVMEGYRNISAYDVPDDSMSKLRGAGTADNCAFLDENRILSVSPSSAAEITNLRNRDVKALGKSTEWLEIANSYDQSKVLFYDRGSLYLISPSGVRHRQWDFSLNPYGIRYATAAVDGRLFAVSSLYPDATVVRSRSDGEWEKIFSFQRPNDRYILSGATKLMFPAGKKATLIVSFAPRDKSGTRRDYFLFDIASKKLIAEKTDRDASVTMRLDTTGRILCVGATDGTLRGYDANTLDHRYTVRAHDGKITAICFRPDGQILASGDETGLIRFWRMDNGVPTTQLRELSGNLSFVRSLEFSPSGQQLISLSGSMLYRWKEKVPTNTKEDE